MRVTKEIGRQGVGAAGPLGGEMILKTDHRGRVRVPAAKREEILDAFERSAMSGAAFARSVGVKYTTFAHWVQRRSRECRDRNKGQEDQALKKITGGSKAKPPLALLEAVIIEEPKEPEFTSSSHAGVEIETLGGLKLRVSTQADVALAVELVKALSQIQPQSQSQKQC